MFSTSSLSAFGCGPSPPTPKSTTLEFCEGVVSLVQKPLLVFKVDGSKLVEKGQKTRMGQAGGEEEGKLKRVYNIEGLIQSLALGTIIDYVTKT